MLTDAVAGPGGGERPPDLGRHAGGLGRLYRDEWAQWNVHYKPYFKIAARVLGLGFVLGFAVFLIWPAQEQKALLLLLKALKDIPFGAPPLVLALTLFSHNARASLIAVAAGGVPFLCLPILDPFMNGAALGLLASVSKHQGLNVPLVFLKSVVPHGLFEIPAVLYATSAGVHLSVTLGKVLRAKLNKKRAAPGHEPSAAPPPGTASGTTTGGPELGGGPAEAGPGEGRDGDMYRRDVPSLVGCLVWVVRSFVLVVLPLLFVAAFIEAYVTPSLR